MTGVWLTGLLRRRSGSLLLASLGVAVAVALLASLGSFIAASQATMTDRATAGVAVDWQVAVRPNAAGGGLQQVLTALHQDPATKAALPVSYADTPGLSATAGGSTQTTGAGQVLGVPASYAATFPGEIHLLTGSLHGAVVAQQTASNLHVGPGGTIHIRRPGLPDATVRVSGVVDLPQADSLFQRVGAPPQSQLAAPPDNVVLLRAPLWSTTFSPVAKAHSSFLSQQVHVRRSHDLPSSPDAAYTTVLGQANNLQARTSGVAVVGNNLGATLDAARSDAAYAQVLFLFLAAPGAVLGGALTGVVAQAGALRRRREQSLLRARGATTNHLVRLVVLEGAVISVLGGVLGLLAAAVTGLVAFRSAGFGAAAGTTVAWDAVAFAVGVGIVGLTVVGPARRTLTRGADELTGISDTRNPWWMRWYVDVLALGGGLAVLWAAGTSQYSLVLAPEGVPQLSVNYWAFAAPALAWVAAALLGWRLGDLLLKRGRRGVAATLRPWGGPVADYAASMLSRQRRPVVRTGVLVGLAVAFAASTATFNATYHQQAEADAQLTNGADINVTQSPGAVVPASAGARLTSVHGVQAVTPLVHRFAYVGSDLQNLYGIDTASLRGATTLQDAYFQGGTANDMMSRLAAHPDGALISAETAKDFQLHLGDHLRLRLQNAVTRTYRSVTFRYVGIANEFPTAPKDSFIVANGSYVTSQTHDPSVGSFLISTGGTNVPSVAKAVAAVVGTGAHVGTIGQARGQVGSSLTSVDLSGLTRIELAFAALIAVAAGVLGLGLGLHERRRGLALATLLGASRRQLNVMAAGEPLFVAVFGTLVGAVAGWGLAALLTKILSGVFDPPPSTLAVPWLYLATTVVLALAGILLAANVVSRRARSGALAELRGL